MNWWNLDPPVLWLWTGDRCSRVVSVGGASPVWTLRRILSLPSQIRHQRLDFAARTSSRIPTLTFVTVRMVTGKETRTFDKHSFQLVTCVARMRGGTHASWMSDRDDARRSPTLCGTHRMESHTLRHSKKESWRRKSGDWRSLGTAPHCAHTRREQVFVVWNKKQK